MLIGGIALGLVFGVLAGGNLSNLAYIRLHRMGLLFAAVFIRFGTETLLNAGFPPAELLRLPLLGGSFALLLLALWPNRNYPGISLAFIGILSNAAVIVVNGGYMPIWEPALRLAGLEGADVGALPLGDGPDCGVVLGAVDRQAGADAVLHVLQLAARGVQVLQRDQGGVVGMYGQRHWRSSSSRSLPIWRVAGCSTES
jgi:hypothetical protein